MHAGRGMTFPELSGALLQPLFYSTSHGCRNDLLPLDPLVTPELMWKLVDLLCLLPTAFFFFLSCDLNNNDHIF